MRKATLTVEACATNSLCLLGLAYTLSSLLALDRASGYAAERQRCSHVKERNQQQHSCSEVAVSGSAGQALD